MEFWSWNLILLLALQLSTVISKRKHSMHTSSDESIENVLYYKDCKHKQKTTPAPVPLRMQEPPQPACPCPRMCCSMCCECEASQSFMGRQMAPLQMGSSMSSLAMQMQSPSMKPQLRSDSNMNSMNSMNSPVHPLSQQQRQKKKKMKDFMLPPIGGRRNLGFTKEDIKSLISRDEDIKQILDDLVKVTMLKVNSKDSKDMVKPTEIPRNGDDDYVE